MSGPGGHHRPRDRSPGHGHSHAHGSIRSGARYKGRLLLAFGVLLVFMVVEVVAGILSNSLALLSDAGHMVTDVLGLGMALAAIHLADRGSRRSQHTFGLYRLEILAALANAVLLFAVAGYVLFEAIRRFSQPVEVLGTPMLVVAVLGLGANLVAFALLRSGAKESINIQGAYLEVLADTIGSVGVIIAAIVLQATGWSWVDPLVGIGIGVFILPRTWRLAAQAVRILIQAAPPGLDLAAVKADLEAIDEVVDVHDLHVWTLTSEMEVASAHVRTSADADGHGVLDAAREILRDRYGIDHATFQVEPEGHLGCEETGW